MNRGRKGRSPDQIRKDRAEVARLYLEGWTQADIGDKLGLSRQQIAYDLEAVRQEWLRSALVDFDAKKAEQLAKIDKLEREYWAAWDASKQERQTSTTEQTTDAEGERLKAAIRKTGQTGDPRYLAGVERCIEQRAKILGLHAPAETRLTGQGSGPIQFIEVVRPPDANPRCDEPENDAQSWGSAGTRGPALGNEAGGRAD